MVSFQALFINWLNSYIRPRAGFDKENLEWLEKIFKQTVGNEGEICREEFKTIVTSKNVGRRHKYSSSLKHEILISHFSNIKNRNFISLFSMLFLFCPTFQLYRQNWCIKFCTALNLFKRWMHQFYSLRNKSDLSK